MAAAIKPRCLELLLLLLLILLLGGASAARTPGPAAVPGGWSEINANDTHVIEIGKFAVGEYNRVSHERLEFKKVVNAYSQVVAGTNYKLAVAVNGGVSGTYEAVVWQQLWRNSTQLTSFKPLDEDLV